MTQRPIKFRAWDTKEKKLWLWPKSPYDNKTVDLNEQFRCLQATGTILMQFTGLHDKNGKEIYLGDVVQLYSGRNDNERMYKGRVNQDPDSGTWILDNGKDDESAMEYINAYRDWWRSESKTVIGNIYENPDLLK